MYGEFDSNEVEVKVESVRQIMLNTKESIAMLLDADLEKLKFILQSNQAMQSLIKYCPSVIKSFNESFLYFINPAKKLHREKVAVFEGRRSEATKLSSLAKDFDGSIALKLNNFVYFK